jgi:DNA-binding transcriptional LysR family regulator
MMDKFNALATLVCVVEQNSFSRAAEQLGKTPSAVAKAIAALESELGSKLFERTTRRMQLTEAGRLYAQAAREALGCLGHASEAIGQMQHGLHGELRIAAALAFGPAFLAEACAQTRADRQTYRQKPCGSECQPGLLGPPAVAGESGDAAAT